MRQAYRELEEFMDQEAPCDLCEYRITCKNKQLTCQSFRDYVLEAQEFRGSYAWPRKPDRALSTSFWGK